MKNKIINSNFDEKTGISRITIQNKYGKFTGFSFCHPDDIENVSMYAGYRYAETRAGIEFAKYRLKQEKIKLNTIQNLLKEIDLIKEDKNKTIKHIWKKEKEYKDNVQYFKDVIDILTNSIKLQDEERQKILRRSNKNK